ncbi:hypothetical protein [Paenibacillus sp. S150]|uniref:hypothetical protein n=1 Tax=Paenibacillus sp. S150 TaxID=2749826 RepID=UPI001C561C03|nr:hypothetical protein [Paenibacillus sp. S150]MBW4083930.1 hypothetical protein [Paenibacillus sp. S150]
MRRTLLGTMFVFSLAFMFFLGYKAGHNKNVPEITAEQAIQSRWVQADQPPSPGITINGTAIDVKRSGYSWCVPAAGSCISVDAAIPELDPVAVPGGSAINTTAPAGIREFSLVNMNADGKDAYVVPGAKGVYTYRIHCEWFLEQGQAEFYFSVEVE